MDKSSTMLPSDSQMRTKRGQNGLQNAIKIIRVIFSRYQEKYHLMLQVIVRYD